MRGFLFTIILYKYLSTYPEIITMLFDASMCRDVGGERYLIGNTSVLCDEYDNYRVYFVYPFLGVWGVLIPAILFLFVMKIRMQ